MDRDYFMNAGIPPPQFDSSTPFPWSGLSSTADQPFMDHGSSMEQYSHFESPFSSMVSSPPAATSSAMSNDAFVLRELIGKLGTVAAAFPSVASPFAGTTTASSPLSPPKLNLPILDQINIPNLPPTPPLPSLAADPGFAERAAKFSCFGSRSFNERTSPFGANNVEMGRRSSNQLKLPRVSSSPALKIGGSSPENRNSSHLTRAQMENSPGNGNGNLLGSEKKLSRLSSSAANSNEESSVSEQIPSGETGSKTSNEMDSRKRKGVSKGKSKEDNIRSSSAKVVEGNDNRNAKRPKATESGKNETRNVENAANDEIDKQKDNEKPPEAPKDYIHVRARRGQATDSHSLAERVRREKISERMKLLQDLVPGCNKVTGKALMLDEIINYVQSLQRQVEFLSMKLASVNPGLDFNMENLVSKDMFQQNGTLPQQMYPLDSSAPAPPPAFYNHQPHQNTQQNNNNHINTKISSQSSVDPLQLIHSLDGFTENPSQFPSFSEDDLHSIVQMGFVQNSVSFPVQNQTSNMKVER